MKMPRNIGDMLNAIGDGRTYSDYSVAGRPTSSILDGSHIPEQNFRGTIVRENE
jgi:hypothetical protein